MPTIRSETVGIVATTFFLLCCPLLALAGFPEALTAFQQKNYSSAIEQARTAASFGDPRASYLLGIIYENGLGVDANASEAVTWYERAASRGVTPAYLKLAQANLKGEGTPRNVEKALAYARVSSSLDVPEGSFLVHAILIGGPLSYFGADKKPDQSKYSQLASRPVSERLLDREAYDSLYRAADKEYPLAIYSLALSLGAIVGENNREQLLTLVGKIPNHTDNNLKAYEKIARHINSLGQSFTSPQLFLDAQTSQLFAAMLRTCGMPNKNETEKRPTPTLKSIAIARPLRNAVYLPSDVAGREHSYLVAGEWEEDWTYEGCGTTAAVRIRFIADGLGGARFFSEQSGKDIPGLAKP